MAISFTRPDPSSPSSVASASFPTSRKGFEQSDVREFLRMVAAELARLQERERFLERELRTSQRSTSPSSIALDEELVTKMLGEEAARILSTARDAGSQIKVRAEEAAARLLREATDEAQRVREEAEIEAARRRQDAAADAEAELEMAKQQGRDMVNEARAYRERVLNELARRRELARQQIEQLVHGRDRLLQAFERSRLVAVDVMAELTPLGEPSEYVDLSPTTGPVPLMLPNMPRPGSEHAGPHDQDDQPGDIGEAVDVADDDATTVLSIVETEETEETVDWVGLIQETPFDDSAFTDDEATDDLDDVADDASAEVAEAEVGEPELPHDTVVRLDIQPSEQSHDDDPDREPARVVALFDVEREPDEEPPAASEADTVADEQAGIDPTATSGEPADGGTDEDETRTSADDLFARLRAARAEGVAQRAMQAEHATVDPTDPTEPVAAPVEDSVFHATPDAPAADLEVEDTPFARRDEVLTPLIVGAARKLKRVLADEQNDVLHALRGKEPVRAIDRMVGSEADHVARYVSAIASELSAAAAAGAVSTGMRSSVAQREVKRADATGAAAQLVATELIAPLRERLERCISDAEGDNAEMASLVRLVYREWKSQRIDEHLDDVARMAFGHGALAGIEPGTPICWVVDPHGPQCPDAEDNALAGVVHAGDPFPTEHRCAPAHNGCRCMIVTARD
ncbi:MAG: DivIVA domain-containing protein [Ilumatobacteraceae bacterium]